MEIARARGYRTRAGNAGTDGVSRRALGPTGFAVVGVRVEIDFAAVARVAVAVSKTRVTGAYAANAQCAIRGCMGESALVATAAAIVGISILVRFAAVGYVIVAIAERFLAIGDVAFANRLRIGRADGRPVRLVLAHGRARAAVVHTL